MTKQRAAEGAMMDGASTARYALVVFLVALALLNTQVSVTRLLAYRFFYHFVFFVISLSQLGLAAAGAWIYASRRTSWSVRELSFWLFGLAFLPVAVLACYGWLSPASNLSFAKVDGPAGYPYLAAIGVLLVALNFCGGMALTLLFTTFKERIGELYASDLVGASVGCLASVLLMMGVGPIRALLASGVAAACALGVLASRQERPAQTYVAAGAMLLLLGGAGLRPEVFDPYAPNPKAYNKTIVRSEWNHVARTDAPMPGKYVIDGDASTDIRVGGRNPPDPEYALVRERPAVAIIGVGAGPQLRVAVAHQARSILAIDINPTIVRWALEDDAEFNQRLFHQPSVTVRVGDGRHVLRSQPDEFDLIVMHAVDTWTASSQGAYSLSENFLYTSESIDDLLSALEPGGVLSIRRWLFWPPRENLRLFTTVLDALEQRGVSGAEDHIVVVSPRGLFTDPTLRAWGYILVSNEAFSAEQLTHLDADVARRGWGYMYRPGQEDATPFQDYVDAENKQTFFAGYPYIVTPSRDSNPFFFQFSPPWLGWSSEKNKSSAIIYGQSADVLLLCLLLATGFAVVLLGVPLYLRRHDMSGDAQRASCVLYFACLGLGFMAFELPAIQVMTLFLGHPTYALSVVLLGLLAAAGIGSALMGRSSARIGRGAVAAAVVLAIGSALALLPMVHALIELPDWARFTTTLVYLVVVGVPLGMPFVAGVRWLDPERPQQVAWAWAVNGAAAVVGSCLLMFLMVFGGSSLAFGVAAACYTVALFAQNRLAMRSPLGGY